MTNKRTDCHRPSAIIPAHYRCLLAYIMPGADPVRDPSWNLEARRALEGAAKAAGKAVYGCAGNCGVCGAVYRYGGIFQHEPTGDLVHMGHDCADKYEMMADWSEMELERGRLDRARAARIAADRNREARACFLDANPGLAEALDCDHAIVRDIAARFRQYCSLSPAQVALVLKLDREARERAARPAERHVDAPEGRQVVRGVLVQKKYYDNDFGSTLKGTVKIETPDGSWLCFFTIPESLRGGSDPVLGYQGAERGDVVEFTATLKRGKDHYFALGSRPTKGRIVERAKQAA